MTPTINSSTGTPKTARATRLPLKNAAMYRGTTIAMPLVTPRAWPRSLLPASA